MAVVPLKIFQASVRKVRLFFLEPLQSERQGNQLSDKLYFIGGACLQVRFAASSTLPLLGLHLSQVFGKTTEKNV